jgi:hypothetical protein
VENRQISTGQHWGLGGFVLGRIFPSEGIACRDIDRQLRQEFQTSLLLLATLLGKLIS